MKNIHVVQTDKPSRLFNYKGEFGLAKGFQNGTDVIVNQNIYITSDEEIKEGVNQWYLDKVLNEPYNSGGAQYSSKQDVIILTTDLDLIKDGVQIIDNEFLEWLVNNPSCEEVEIRKEYITPLGDIVETCYDNERLNYKIIIPKEEPKHELPEIGTKEFNDLCSRFFGGERKQKTLESLTTEEITEMVFCNKQETLEKASTKYLHSVADGKRYTGYADEDFINGAKWQEDKTIEEVFEWLTTQNYLTDLKETLIENFKEFKNK